VEKEVILDNRIVTKPYGHAFMQALPKCQVKNNLKLTNMFT